jgi:hypothetical protein
MGVGQRIVEFPISEVITPTIVVVFVHCCMSQAMQTPRSIVKEPIAVRVNSVSRWQYTLDGHGFNSNLSSV